MSGQQAKLISLSVLRRVLGHVQRHSQHPARDRAMILLSVRAGLRAAEIAQLTWPMVLDASGHIGDTLAVPDRIAKKGSGRRLPLHPELRDALVDLMQLGDNRSGPVVGSVRGGAMRANSIVNWFVALFAELGVDGCSSHSGRRTFITLAARNAHRAGCSLRDVQLLAGHRSIETTQRYIDGDTVAQRKLVSLL
jgi:integrase/recombinase XerD